MKSNIETYLRLKPILNPRGRNNLDSYNDALSISNHNIIDNPENSSIEYQINKNKNLISVRIPEEFTKGYVNNTKKTYDFKFNGIFEQDSTQEDIFDKIGKTVIKNSLEGYNNTVFCYGQTGSGKTYTMCGSKNWKERGLIPRLLIELFKQIREMKTCSYDIFVSYLEIYNENAYDLLDKAHSETDIEDWKKIIVYEDNYNNTMLKNLSMIKVENEQQALDLLITGNYIRHISSTQMNMASSRSHAIFSCILEGRELTSEVMRASKINLVDLAGSERMKSNINSITSVETKYINLSLSFLEQVILALNEKEKGSRSHIPYRNSLMTTILKDSLGGNCKTILIANVASTLEFLEETISTMRFSVRCGKVQNQVTKNEHMDLNMLVSKLQNENIELRKKLQEQIQQKESSGLVSLEKKDLSEFEKDECKILISDYLNDKSENKQIKATNTSQLFYIIDFLINYINNKETVYKGKMQQVLNENKELIKIATEGDEKIKKICEIIKENNLENMFREVLSEKPNNDEE